MSNPTINEKEQNEKMKETYSIKEIPCTYDINFPMLGNLINKWFESHKEPLSEDKFEEIKKSCLCKIYPKEEEKYKCPKCGEFELQAVNYGDYDSPKYAIACNSCNFAIKEKRICDYDAWKTFHRWLIKHGYLDESVKSGYWS